MTYISGFLIVLFLLGSARLNAQSIKADRTSGCDSFQVNFSLDPPVAAGTTISWNFGNGKTSSGNLSPSVSYTEPGIYSISCLINNTFTINAPNYITVYKTPSSAFRFNDSLSVSPYYYVFRYIRIPADTGMLDFTWVFPEGVTETTSNAGYDFGSPGTYQVRLIVASSVGCSDTSIREIGVASLLEAPNVFTPNDDAINDFFQIRTDGINTYTFSVYTRSGVLVYRSESPSIIWDGRSFSGQIVTPGIYYYTIEQRGGGPSTKQKGIIYLLK